MIDMVNLTSLVKIDIHTENVEFQVLSLVEHYGFDNLAMQYEVLPTHSCNYIVI